MEFRLSKRAILTLSRCSEPSSTELEDDQARRRKFRSRIRSGSQIPPKIQSSIIVFSRTLLRTRWSALLSNRCRKERSAREAPEWPRTVRVPQQLVARRERIINDVVCIYVTGSVLPCCHHYRITSQSHGRWKCIGGHVPSAVTQR